MFRLPAGLYWRGEEGGLLFGMSDPDERPGEALGLDRFEEHGRSRLAADAVALPFPRDAPVRGSGAAA